MTTRAAVLTTLFALDRLYGSLQFTDGLGIRKPVSMDITNKSDKPLNVPLPGGKRLFLAPGKTGQVSPKALDHPALAKLIESGDLETSAVGPKRRDSGAGRVSAHPGPGHAGRVPRKQTGDL